VDFNRLAECGVLMNLQVPLNVDRILNSVATVGFSRTRIHGVS
jgi:hypothetical protein